MFVMVLCWETRATLFTTIYHVTTKGKVIGVVSLPGSPILYLDIIGVGLHSFCSGLSTLYSSLSYGETRLRGDLHSVKCRCSSNTGRFIWAPYLNHVARGGRVARDGDKTVFCHATFFVFWRIF